MPKCGSSFLIPHQEDVHAFLPRRDATFFLLSCEGMSERPRARSMMQKTNSALWVQVALGDKVVSIPVRACEPPYLDLLQGLVFPRIHNLQSEGCKRYHFGKWC